FETAIRVLAPCLFGPTHPYGHPAVGTEEGVKAAAREDLVGFYRTWFTPANAALVLAGDLTEAEARRLAAQAFGAWSGGRSETPPPPTPTPIPERTVIV